MAAGSLTASAADAPAGRAARRLGWLDEARSGVYWGLTHGLPRLAARAVARRGDIAGRLMLAAPSGDEVRELSARARASGPVHRSRLTWLTVDHAAAKEILSSPDFRTVSLASAQGPLGWVIARTAPDLLHPLEPPSLLVTEPPDHIRYRKLVTGVFTARAVERLRARTEAIAHELLDALVPSAPADLISSYCGLLPVTVIAEILGVPAADRERLLVLGSRAAPSLDFGLGWRQYRAVSAGLRDFDRWLDAHIEQLRRHPGEDLLSRLIQARDEQGTLDSRELKATAGLVLAAGFETTANLLGNAIALLCGNPGQLDRLRAEPGLWPNAVDETLRLDPPVLLTGRECVRPTSVAGTSIPQGTIMLTILAGANRDPRVFTDPDRFDVTRHNARDHLSFSAGRHHCLGAALARMEGEIGLRTLFHRFPHLELLPGAQRRPTRILRGFQTLPAQLVH